MLALTFQIGQESIGLDIRRVREVIPRVKLQPLTGSAVWLAGVFVYRGAVIPVVDLHRLMGVGECPPHLSSRIILLPISADDPAGQLFGLLAGQVADLREITSATSATSAPAENDGGTSMGSVVADGEGVLRLLDPDRFLPATARRQILAAAGVTA